MKEKEYITIGNPIITKDVFKQILRPLDNYTHKPIGGLWASEATSLIYGICHHIFLLFLRSQKW